MIVNLSSSPRGGRRERGPCALLKRKGTASAEAAYRVLTPLPPSPPPHTQVQRNIENEWGIKEEANTAASPSRSVFGSNLTIMFAFAPSCLLLAFSCFLLAAAYTSGRTTQLRAGHQSGGAIDGT